MFFNGALASVICTIFLVVLCQFLLTGAIVGALCVKLFVVFLALCVNYTFGREYKTRKGEKETIQKFAIVSCSLIIGMLVTSTNNLLVANMFLDASSMLFAGLLIVGTNSYGAELNRSSKIAFNYLVASALTSVFSYVGSALILLTAGTYNIQSAATNIMINASGNDRIVFSVGAAFWAFKLLFALGLFPFHNYVFNSSRVLTIPSNFFMFTSMKISPLFIFILLADTVIASDSSTVKTVVVIASAVSVAIGSFSLYESFALRNFFAASSLSTTAFSVIVLTAGGAYPAAVAALNFFVYCITLAAFMLFFVFIIEGSQRGNDRVDTPKEVKTAGELRLLDLFKIKVVTPGVVNMRALENDEVAQDIFR